MDVSETAAAILKEIASVISETNVAQTEAFTQAVLRAPRIFVFGEGRSGLVARAFAMRLMQLGLEAHVVGETTTPALAKGDLLVAVSGSGETASTLLFAEKSKKAEGRVAAVVASATSRLAGLADMLLVIPGRAKTGVGMNSIQIPGSLFEQAALMYLDAAVAVLAHMRGQSHGDVSGRHSNLQ